MSDPLASATPRAEYQSRLAARQAAVATLERGDARFANGRLVLFLAFVALIIFAATGSAVHWFWPILPLVAFVVLAVRHDALLRQLKRARRSVRFYESGLARIDDRWAGKGAHGLDLVPPNHPYAADMDIFGKGSLFELLCTARTKAGEESLADWLCAPAGVPEIVARQQAVDELRGNIDLREELAIAADDVRAEVRPKVLADWAALPVRFTSRGILLGARLLTAATVFTGLGWAFWGFTYSPFLLCVMAELICLRVWKKDLASITEGVNEPAKELNVLSAVLAHLEQANVTAAKLEHLQQRLKQNGRTASQAIARLDSLVQWLDAERNMMFAPIAVVVMWRVHFAGALERWRATYGRHVPEWLAALGELETLCAFAGYAYEHPDHPFADVQETGRAFNATGLGHPLLPAPQRVCNDIAFGERPQALIVSGSNMSGKSTLLRTIGINTALALAGAPVCARSLRLSVCALGATIRIEDSIQRGASRFYAEITRIKQLFDIAQDDLPLLFLLDELFGGTNSHDRGVGAAALIKGFLDAGAMGLVTTHDLALTQLTDDLGDRVSNVHFEDHLEGDRLVFDYTLKPGVVQKSNALELMRAIGLQV